MVSASTSKKRLNATTPHTHSTGRRTVASSPKTRAASSRRGRGGKRSQTPVSGRPAETDLPVSPGAVRASLASRLAETSQLTETVAWPLSIQESPQCNRHLSRVTGEELAASKLFEGMTFLVTHFEQASIGSPVSPLRGDVSFDKNEVCDCIEKHGGCLLDAFDLAAVNAAKTCLLISDNFHRTVKYLCALAAGIPCVSHLWIRDCCSNGVLLDYKNYVLPAGVCLEENCVVERVSLESPLVGMMVVLASENESFKQVWLDVLEAAGCNVLTRLPAYQRSSNVDILVADKHISSATLTLAKDQELPVVSSEWVVQCLIAGRRLSFSGHAKYLHSTAV